VNNDWKNWVVMHGNERMAVEDVWGIGKAISVKFTDDNANRFSALVRAKNGKQAQAAAAWEAIGCQ
ncbi:endonuclease/exonuclease/phosphatase family protein, partial [Trifolium medium]|nr:endonuclease/exonuclease/phosphatase family protein [Trifolium medium]